MRYLILSQVFYPDTVSVSQHLSDLAQKLVESGHKVKVVTSQYPYEKKDIRYERNEVYSGIRIVRLFQTSFGKERVLFRLLDYFSFYCSIGANFLFLRKKEYDIVLVTTSPPLLAFIVALVCKLKGVKFIFWAMDLQPELSISVGLITEHSIVAKFLRFTGDFAIKNAHKIITLDRFMKNYLVSRGAKNDLVNVIPVWPVMDRVYKGERLSNPFRQDNGFGDKIVIMYSGNHSLVHELYTLLEAALLLRRNCRFIFVFIGGGVRVRDVVEFKTRHRLDNIVQLPFQPRENIHNSLGSSDIQVVILGKCQVGYTHPNKVYGAMYIGKPILYIGPTESHIASLLDDLKGNISVQHGESQILAQKLEGLFSRSWDEIINIGENNLNYAIENFHPEVLKQKMVDSLNG